MGQEGGSASRRAHWDRVFSTRAEHEVSWFEEVPETSLALIGACELKPNACILDVGAGASRLPDVLLRYGFADIVVLDISASAIERTRARLKDAEAAVRYVVADVTAWRPDFKVDLWHDRAMLHFLTEESARSAYAAALRHAVRAGGYVIVAGFAPTGPERCSGLPVMRADQHELAALLGAEFVLLDAVEKDHLTPGGTRQRFLYTRFRRRVA